MILNMLLLSAALSAAPAPLTTVSSVDVQRYVGTWYEVARFPNFFQKGCELGVATYQLGADGGIEILNHCTKPDGSEKQAPGVAKVVDPATNAKLRVSFVPAWMRWTGIGWGDYWVIALAPDYSYSVVSGPKRKYLWIMSRTPVMDREVYEKILARLTAMDFDVSQLISAGPGRLKPAAAP